MPATITQTETFDYFKSILPRLDEKATARLIVETAAILKEEKDKEKK